MGDGALVTNRIQTNRIQTHLSRIELRRQCIRPGPFHQEQGHRLGRRLVSTTAEDIEAVSLEAKILRARSRPRLQPTYRISVLKTPVTWPARANWERRVGPSRPTSWLWRANYLARTDQLLGRRANYLAQIVQVVGPDGPSTWLGRPQEWARAAPGVGPARPRSWPEVDQVHREDLAHL